MTIDQWLKTAGAKLAKVDIGSAHLDSLILLEDALQKDRAWILAHKETALNNTQVGKLKRQIDRRSHHEPLAYIRGFTEFYGRRFKINRHVLEPRPESETMIELLKNLPLPDKPAIADIGTGSGAIGITASLEIHKTTVDLYDIDSYALAVARHNTVMHELHLHAYKRDLLNRPARAYDVLLANLPYVPDHWKINDAAAMEPRIAIFGGKDGLDVYRRFFGQLETIASRPKFVLTEALPPQHPTLAEIAADGGYQLRQSEDFIQIFEA